MKSDIRGFSIDLNWDLFGRPTSPGLYRHADPQAHVDWYSELGANVIQSFCVSYNGYAYFPSELAPVVPGMAKFFNKQIQLGHQRSMKVMGYFCLGSNPFYITQRPSDEWYNLQGDGFDFGNAHSAHSIPFSDRYLDFFCSVIREALERTEMDGFMIDWFRILRAKTWIGAERHLWKQLMGEDFPTCGAPPEKEILEFDRRQFENAWVRIRDTVSETRPALIWTNHPFTRADDPVWTGHRLLKEVDWVLNESPDFGILGWLQNQCGPQTKIIQNICGWSDHTPDSWKEVDQSRFGLYGFAAANPDTTLPWTKPEVEAARRPIMADRYLATLSNNADNIETIRHGFLDLARRSEVKDPDPALSGMK